MASAIIESAVASKLRDLVNQFVNGCSRILDSIRNSILSDHEIAALCVGKGKDGMIFPYVDRLYSHNEAGEKIISYGQSSYGYDIRSAPEFHIFTNLNSTVIDPKQMDKSAFVTVAAKSCIIPPNSFILCRTMEYFKMPPDVTGVVLGKSTLARAGLVCIATPLEAGWEGELVLEFANLTPLPMIFYAEEGCAQILFFRGKKCKTSYRDRGGKYQGQTGIELSKV